MAMTACRSFLLLSLLSACGCAPISAALDESAMVQVSAGVSAVEKSGSYFDLTAEVGQPDPEEIKRTVESAVRIYKKKVEGDSAVMMNISKELTQAWAHEVTSQLQNGVKYLSGMEKQARRRVAGNGAKVRKYVKGGNLSSAVFKWIAKMADAHGAIARNPTEANIDGQKQAVASFLLLDEKDLASQPDAAMVKKSIETAFDIYKKKSAGDAEMIANISKTLGAAWESEVRGFLKKIADGAAEKQHEDRQKSRDANEAINKWLKENVKDGKLVAKVWPSIQKMVEAASPAARQQLAGHGVPGGDATRQSP